MTRINIGIPPKKLSDQHLLAEHREIKRLVNWDKKSIINKFTLGKGHVLFFSDKHLYIYNRYCELYDECLKRGFKVTNYKVNWEGLRYKNDYNPSNDDIKIIKERLSDRIENAKCSLTYYKEKVSTQFLKDLLK
jgi:deoxyribonuclease (pyrimidine dimer)